MTVALQKLIKDTIKKHKRIVFNGNGYDEGWIKEATEVRGLHNLRTTPDALPAVLEKKNFDMLISHGVLTEAEIHSRYEITLENYCKTVNIEGLTMVDMAKREIVPAIDRYIKKLADTVVAKKTAVPTLTCAHEISLITNLSGLVEEADKAITNLDTALIKLKTIGEVTEAANYIRDHIIGKMAELRVVCDEAETLTPKALWPFPTYEDLLFGVK